MRPQPPKIANRYVLPSVNPTTTAAWKALEAHAVEAKNWHLRDLLAAEADRFERMHVRVDDLLLFDYAKHRLSETTLSLLEQLFAECGAPEALQAQLSGEAINQTENRAVLHSALRDPRTEALLVNGEDARALAKGERDRMFAFAEAYPRRPQKSPSLAKNSPMSSTSVSVVPTWAPAWPLRP